MVLIFVDQTEGHIKKSSFEVLTYGSKLAEQMGTTAEALLLGTVNDDLAALGKYGVKKVHHLANETLTNVYAPPHAKVISNAVTTSSSNVRVCQNKQTSQEVSSSVGARSQAVTDTVA